VGEDALRLLAAGRCRSAPAGPPAALLPGPVASSAAAPAAGSALLLLPLASILLLRMGLGGLLLAAPARPEVSRSPIRHSSSQAMHCAVTHSTYARLQDLQQHRHVQVGRTCADFPMQHS
jgi:hypothetical protein